MRNLNSTCKVTNAILSTLRLLDQYASSRRQTYTNRDLYMADFRGKLIQEENKLKALEEGKRCHDRVSFEGNAAIITEEAYLKGFLGNLSSGGVYIMGERRVFRIHENVRLKIKPTGHHQTLKSSATLVRIDHLPCGNFGYALCFHLV